MAPVLKTGEVKASVGSNPTPSAFFQPTRPQAARACASAGTTYLAELEMLRK